MNLNSIGEIPFIFSVAQTILLLWPSSRATQCVDMPGFSSVCSVILVRSSSERVCDLPTSVHQRAYTSFGIIQWSVSLFWLRAYDETTFCTAGGWLSTNLNKNNVRLWSLVLQGYSVLIVDQTPIFLILKQLGILKIMFLKIVMEHEWRWVEISSIS